MAVTLVADALVRLTLKQCRARGHLTLQHGEVYVIAIKKTSQKAALQYDAIDRTKLVDTIQVILHRNEMSSVVP